MSCDFIFDIINLSENANHSLCAALETNHTSETKSASAPTLYKSLICRFETMPSNHLILMTQV